MSELLLLLIKGLLTKTVVDELGAAIQGLAHWLVKRSSDTLVDERERYEEEWLAHLGDCKTPLRKIGFALGIVHAARVLRRDQSTKRIRARRDPTVGPAEEGGTGNAGSASDMLQVALLDERKKSQVLSRDDMVRAYELAKDQYVQFTVEEIKALEASESANCKLKYPRRLLNR